MNATDATTTTTTPITLTTGKPRRGFIMNPAPLPAGVLADDGRHANPAALIEAMSDADTRTGSTGLAYLADHTNAAALTPSAAEVARRWTITTTNGFTATGYLPEWSETDPTATGVRSDRLENRLSDLDHTRYFSGQTMVVDTPFGDGETGREIYEAELLRGQIVCHPYSGDPAKRVPTVSVEVINDCLIQGLDPVGVCELADKLRAQAELLDQVAAELSDAREDWARNGGAR